MAIRGYALYRRQFGGQFWGGVLVARVGSGPVWTRSEKRARVFPDLPSAYAYAKDKKILQDCIPVAIVDQ